MEGEQKEPKMTGKETRVGREGGIYTTSGTGNETLMLIRRSGRFIRVQQAARRNLHSGTTVNEKYLSQGFLNAGQTHDGQADM
jgi:hypothetical protein